MTVAIYCRISKEEEGSHSLASQEARLRDYCRAMQWGEAEVFTDNGISGKNTARPAFQAMMQRVLAGDVKRICVVALSRLSRSVRDTLDVVDTLRKHDCDLVSLGESLDTATPAGRLVLTILAAVSELEREQISSRTKAGLAQAKAEGVLLGAPRWGLNHKGETVEAEQKVIEAVVAAMKAGLSQSEIARRFADKRVENPRSPGNVISRDTVGRIVAGLPDSIKAHLPQPKRGRPRK